MTSVEGARSMARHRPAEATEPAAMGGNVAATPLGNRDRTPSSTLLRARCRRLWLGTVDFRVPPQEAI